MTEPQTRTKYTYDNDGNLVTKVNSAGTTQYFWDYENRMTSVTLPGSGGTVSFKYDPFGRRIYKSSSSATSVYAYDGDNLIEETNSSGTAVARYSQGLNIDEPLAMLRSATTSYYQADGLGTITSLSSGAGALAQTYTFDSFGNQTASSGSLTNPFQYTARESDPETGLYYYRARYYDPTSGRFLSEDPKKFSGGLNFYTYAGNDSVGFRDPTGLDYHYDYDPGTNTLTIGARVVIWGPNANANLAASWERDAERYWNAQAWKYGNCNVRFQFDFSVGGTPSQPFPGENNINVGQNPMPGNVLGWTSSSVGVWWQGINDQDVAHEVGHILLLGDDYGRIMPDWLFKRLYGNHDGHMMSNGLIRNVAQHEVDEIVSRTGACQCKQ